MFHDFLVRSVLWILPLSIQLGMGVVLLSLPSAQSSGLQLPLSCLKLDSTRLSDCLHAIVGDLRRCGQRSGDEAWYYQVTSNGKCDAWVSRARNYLDLLTSDEDAHFLLYDAIISWGGPGGRHNLYLGASVDPLAHTVRLFVFDPWKADPAKQFYWLTEAGSALSTINARIGKIDIAWDGIAQTLYLPKGLSVPELKLEANTVGYEEIEIPTVSGKKLKRPAVHLWRSMGSKVRY